ncbi:MAG: hypothetical protein AB8G17_14095 [Gammaproteobacteria bacterium]
MTAPSKVRPAKWFLPVAGVALVWNLLGVVAYLSQMSADLSTLPDAQRAFYESMPAWATAAFAIAVFSGVAGSVGLLLRQSWASPALVLSVAGVAVQMTHSLLLGDGMAIFGPSALVLPLLTLAIGLGLVTLARTARKRSWI